MVQSYIVDAFTDVSFRGSTCAVCLFPEWPEDNLLQKVAIQNQFAETAFIVLRDKANPELRWFTVSQEVDFCGYGTLSAGFVYLSYVAPSENEVHFQTRRYGVVPVIKRDGLLQIEVPVKRPTEQFYSEDVCAVLGGVRPLSMIKSERGDILITYAKEEDVRSITPRFQELMALGFFGYILTSPGLKADYVYRYFSPRMTNVWEDPVNGASQSVLAPYWAHKLGKPVLHGQAVSLRGGDVFCEYTGGATVKIAGRVVPYLRGELIL